MNSPESTAPGTLPVIRATGGEFRPVIVIDTRERTPLAFRRLESLRGTLTGGDYSLRGAEDSFTIERKSIADLVNCCTGAERRRFDRQLHRLGRTASGDSSSSATAWRSSNAATARICRPKPS